MESEDEDEGQLKKRRKENVRDDEKLEDLSVAGNREAWRAMMRWSQHGLTP